MPAGRRLDAARTAVAFRIVVFTGRAFAAVLGAVRAAAAAPGRFWDRVVEEVTFGLTSVDSVRGTSIYCNMYCIISYYFG